MRIEPTGTLSLGIDIDPVRGVADSDRLGEDLTSLLKILGDTARDLVIGVLILVDNSKKPPTPNSSLSTSPSTISTKTILPFPSCS